MLLMHDGSQERVIFLTTPDELRRLAHFLEEMQQYAKPGDSTICFQLRAKDYWSNQVSPVTLDIGWDQNIHQKS